MTRGKPSKEQLDISMPMLENAAKCDFMMSGVDARNYGEPAGVKQARELFADLLGVKADEVIAIDGSSLDIMYKRWCSLQCNSAYSALRRGNKLDKVSLFAPHPDTTDTFPFAKTSASI